MKPKLIETLQNIADNTLADNSMSNFLIRNLAANIGISKGATNSRVGQLSAFGYVVIEKVGQGELIAITELGRKALTEEPQKPERAVKVPGTKRPSKSIPDDYVLLKDFVADAGLARRKLRALKIEKPGAQWAWPVSEVESIKNLLGEK